MGSPVSLQTSCQIKPDWRSMWIFSDVSAEVLRLGPNVTPLDLATAKASSIGDPAHECRGVAPLRRPAGSVLVIGCKLGAARRAISELNDAGPTT